MEVNMLHKEHEPANMTPGDVDLETTLDPNLDPALQIDIDLPGQKQTKQQHHDSDGLNVKDIHVYGEYWDPNINVRLPTHPPPTYPYFEEGTSSTAKHILVPGHVPPHPRPLQTFQLYPNGDVPHKYWFLSL